MDKTKMIGKLNAIIDHLDNAIGEIDGLVGLLEEEEESDGDTKT
jgi:hypothetical protein